MGTLAGPVLGALIFTVMPELLRAFAEYKEFLSGALLLGFLVFFPRGLVGMLGPAWARLGRRFPRRTPPLPAGSSVIDEA
jgi:branched-chain amino acid transport system permease protein